ncbi:hypothetical protein GCM10008959_36680 [Deinococcus seoulensis]|uniref:Uncharacterized protein n=1 Tax=Deinococcus seoulensis TaxID=1837379 RepID=A0ABQ2S039_9DEIO|nr:hypothetical protein [Deinococcus seoulensis]GGR71691.1 hypothetical protein GCM10008959_36680 [Deinococcus seoulensis]
MTLEDLATARLHHRDPAQTLEQREQGAEFTLQRDVDLEGLVPGCPLDDVQRFARALRPAGLGPAQRHPDREAGRHSQGREACQDGGPVLRGQDIPVGVVRRVRIAVVPGVDDVEVRGIPDALRLLGGVDVEEGFCDREDALQA